jgi:hypothetical protein
MCLLLVISLRKIYICIDTHDWRPAPPKKKKFTIYSLLAARPPENVTITSLLDNCPVGM